MASQSYLDVGAVQRIETGSPTAKVGYLDIGAVQRQESTGVGGGTILPQMIQHGLYAGLGGAA